MKASRCFRWTSPTSGSGPSFSKKQQSCSIAAEWSRPFGGSDYRHGDGARMTFAATEDRLAQVRWGRLREGDVPLIGSYGFVERYARGTYLYSEAFAQVSADNFRGRSSVG
jgi:hypothetical protein